MSGPAQGHRRLAERIGGYFARGLTVDAAVMAYIESTLPSADPREVAARLCDPDDGDGRTLLDLILFPDDDLQRELEELLAADPIHPDDAADIGRRVAERVDGFRLRFPSGPRIRVPLTPGAIETFLARLHLPVQIDPRLRTALDVAGDTAALIRIRNHGRTLCGRQAEFLRRLVDGIGPHPDRRRAGVDFMLALFAELAPGADIPAALAAKRRMLERHRRQALRAAALLADTNFEMRIHQGLHLPYAVESEVRKGLERIDDIARAVFGGRLPDERAAGVLHEATFPRAADRAAGTGDGS